MRDGSAAAPALQARGERKALARLSVSTLTLDILLVSGVALALGLIRLGAPALWFDEAYTYKQIQRSVGQQVAGYQPFYYWLQEAWTAIAGTSEWALRFPSVVGAMLSCALLVVLARKLFTREVALLSGLVLAASPMFVKWSQQARGYPFVVAASLVTTLVLLRALERGSRTSWALYGLAYSWMLVMHAVAGLLLAPSQLALIAVRRERVLPHGLLAGVVIAVLGVSWVGQLALRTASDASETAWIPYPSPEYVVHALLDVSGVAGLGLALAVFGLWRIERAGRRDLVVWLGVWALGPFVAALLVSTVREIFVDRYLLVAAPAFAMLVACAVQSVAGRARAAVLVVVVVATSIGLAQWYSTAEHGNWRGEDWRSAVAEIRSRTRRPVVVVPWWAAPAAAYYGADVTDTSTASSVWVLLWSEHGPGLSADVRRPLGFGDHRLVEGHQYGWRVSAQLWTRPSG